MYCILCIFQTRHILVARFADRPIREKFLGAFVKLRKATISFVMFACPSAWNSPPSGRILIKLHIFGFFSPKICRENSSFTEIRQK